MINLIYLLLFSLPLYLIRFDIFAVPTTLLEVEMYIVGALFLVSSILRGDVKSTTRKIIRSSFFIPLILFLVAGILSVFVAADTRIALGIFKAYFFDSVLFFILFTSLVTTKEQIYNSIVAAVLSGVVLALIGFAGYFGYPSFLEDGRLRSVFSSPNYLSLYITPMVFLAIGRIGPVEQIYTKRSFAVSSAVLVLLVALILTFSRGAWLGFLVALAFAVLILIIRKFSTNRVIAFGGFMLAAFLILIFIVRGLYLFGAIPSDRVEKSDSIRVEIWRTSWDIGEQHWLTGVGLGNFQQYFSDYTSDWVNYPEYVTPHAVTPHNMFLNLWLQTGILGLISVLWLVAEFSLLALKTMKKHFTLVLAVSSSMVALLAHGLVESTIWKNDLMIYFWFLLGLITVLNTLEQTKKPH